MPRATYCRPQIVSVGLTEAQAKGQGRSVRTVRICAGLPYPSNAANSSSSRCCSRRRASSDSS
jgi:pyruvate/2-oxoglutarate dehydrogenase complex dihydrolipoamide dehydrogenase (E3) component